MPPKIPGMPCRLLMPHVSQSLAIKGLQNPMHEIAPAIIPTSMAPKGPMAKLAVAPIETPPASVAFCTGTVVRRLPVRKGISAKVVTVEANSARTVLSSAIPCPSVPAGKPPATKDGQKSHKKTVPIKEKRSELYELPLKFSSFARPRVLQAASPK
mmetsp:Transcript_104991/g.165662  ORF Transcript_104991/g.165662 Transcript_104991/m.165662 type:complete len:156 (+) Transcript_104991:355-822(+)